MKPRRSFNDDASRSDEPPPPPPTSCAAYGCPLSAGIIQEGKRYCCVHLDIRDWNDYAGATAEIRKRMKLVEAIALLRSPGHRMDRQTIDDACALWPELSHDPKSPYALLIEAESRMRQSCLTGGNAIYRPQDDVSVAGQIKDMTAAHRMPA